MTFYKKIIAVIGLLTLSVSFCAASTTEVNPGLTPVEVSVLDVCTMMRHDAVTLATMYKSDKSYKYIIQFLENRNDADPAMVFSMPGIMRILFMIEDMKTRVPDLYFEPNFPSAMGIVTQQICMEEHGIGWVQDVPGRAVIPAPTITSSPKIKI